MNQKRELISVATLSVTNQRLGRERDEARAECARLRESVYTWFIRKDGQLWKIHADLLNPPPDAEVDLSGHYWCFRTREEAMMAVDYAVLRSR